MADRKPTPAFWVTVTLVAVLVAYPLSFGPACWAYSRKQEWWLPNLYATMGWLMLRSPMSVYRAIEAYGSLGMPFGSEVYVPISGWEREKFCFPIQRT
jgi:hypothetical protein